MIRIALIALLSILAAVPAAAQDWPSKPVRFIVPFPPGGSVDPLARLLGAKLGDSNHGLPFRRVRAAAELR